MGHRTSGHKRGLIRDGDLIPDNRLSPGDEDLLEHDAIARSVAEIALTAQTPANIALFGAWGSGKSSIYSMITKHLDDIAHGEVKVARYDAWKYGGQDLKRNFIYSVANDLGQGKDRDFSAGLEHEQSKARLDVVGWLKTNQKSLWTGLAVALGIAVVWLTVLLLVSVLVGRSAYIDAVKSLIPQAGTVFGLSLVAVLVGPQVLQGAVVTTKRPAPVGADQFATRFHKLVGRVRSGRVTRLVVFIDELDRCAPDDVVATLIDLKTFLDQDGCTFIVAADREVIAQSLRKVPQAKPVREEEPYYATPGAFLDKIFQHQIALPPLRSRALTQFAHNLVREQHGLWKQLRDRGSDTFEQTIFALVPVHVRSPRRIKILLNNFATNARIAEARGIAWLDRAHELAVLTVLQTEFPAVADELRRVPRLLVYLRGEERTEADEVKALIQRFSNPANDEPNRIDDDNDAIGQDKSETPAGALLSDDDTASGMHKLRDADRTLRHHLSMYLSKVRAAGLADPRPDLLYLQSAGSGDSLGDPRLGDIIDFATDTAPDEVVEAFTGQNSRTLAIAVPLLVTEGDNSYGPGRRFAYEAACRLIERIDDGDDSSRDIVVREATPSLIAANTNRELSPSSLPGALLAACWAGQTGVVATALDDLNSAEIPDDILGRLALLFPYLDQNDSEALSAMFAEVFEQRPEPLRAAVTTLPLGSAVSLWKGAASRVLAAVKRLELPSTESSDAAKPVSAAPPGGTSAESEPTGEGVARIEALIAAVRSRPGHEELLSAVLVSAQSGSSCRPVRSWVLDHADSLIATMTSPDRRARHALLGMLRPPQLHWARWATFLPDNLDHPPSQELASLATEVLVDRLVPAIADSDAIVRTSLAAVIAQVLAFTQPGDPGAALAEAISSVAADVPWIAANPDNAEAVLVWDRKKITVDIAVTLAERAGDSVLEPVIEDLAVAVEECTLTDTFVTEWLALATSLPQPAARTLSDHLDEYEYADTAKTAAVRLKLGLRRVFGGVALPASDLTKLPNDHIDTSMTSTWLTLAPTPTDVRALLATVPFTPAAFGTYCRTLPLDERTEIWLAVEQSPTLDQLLGAAGQGGVGHQAVERIRATVADTSRQSARVAAVARLLLAQTPDEDAELRNVRRAASEFALELLARETAGDVRTAAELILWAGGPGYGHTGTLRTAFTDALTKYKDPLPKSHITQLQALKLLTPKKGLIDLFFGR
ncbi:P-loop NTPase fold protein [Rhodococcus sp. C26F]